MQAQPNLPQNAPIGSQAPPGSSGSTVDLEKQHEYPWKYFGYPGLSQWMASSDDFFVLRRFARVNARYLLYLQHQIGKRAHQLDDMDERSRDLPIPDGRCSSFEKDSMPDRNKLIEELGEYLRKYYDHINAYTQIRDKRTADNHHIQNLQNCFSEYENAIRNKEMYWFDRNNKPHTGDLFEMKSHLKSPLRWLLNKSRIMQLAFRLRTEKPERFDGPAAQYFSNQGFDQFVCFVTVFLGLGLLFAPMWWLHFVNDVGDMLGIITGFVCLFAFWLWVAAGPRQFEILLGTAAYAAVLYIYLQAAKGPGGPKSRLS